MDSNVVVIFFINRHYESSHIFFVNIKGNDRTLKLLQLKLEFFFKFMVDETDVPNYNNLPSNNEKLLLHRIHRIQLLWL